jgi:hypothetical protein
VFAIENRWQAKEGVFTDRLNEWGVATGWPVGIISNYHKKAGLQQAKSISHLLSHTILRDSFPF